MTNDAEAKFDTCFRNRPLNDWAGLASACLNSLSETTPNEVRAVAAEFLNDMAIAAQQRGRDSHGVRRAILGGLVETEAGRYLPRIYMEKIWQVFAQPPAGGDELENQSVKDLYRLREWSKVPIAI